MSTCIHPYRKCYVQRARITIVSIAIIYIAVVGTAIIDSLIENDHGTYRYRMD